ncbi:MAG: ribosome-associated translation inhibitor RaiA [Bacteriovoracaceae bacterium]|nr:ribosome-associated translation inhibitor RaiA [Bacteriovoracaceae bacterium]
MRLKISFKHMEHTPDLDEWIHAKTEKLDKYMDGNIDVQWTCYVNSGKHFAEIKLIGPKFEYHAKADSDSMYKTLDLVVDKIETQLKKKKSKWKDHENKHFTSPKIELRKMMEAQEEKAQEARYKKDVA